MCLLATIVVGCDKPMIVEDNPQAPLRKLSFSVKKEARNELLETLKKFSDRHAFAIRSAPTTPDGEHISIQMWRSDLKAIAINPLEPEKFNIYFYQNSPPPVSAIQLDYILNDLRTALSKHQGIEVLMLK